MATQALIAAKLSDLATLYRQALGSSEATLLAENWHDLLDDLADGDFDAAVRHHCKTSRYFPTPADILKAHVERPRKPCVYSALSERTFTAEDAQWNAVCAAMMSRSLAGSAKAKLFFSGGDRAVRDALAREVLGEKYPAGGESERQRHWGSGPRQASEVWQ